jgi:hypothetical protein
VDWTLAIEKNKAALAQVLDAIFGLLELALNDRLPRRLYFAAERLLRPAESALRRLIVIAAHGLVVSFAPSRPMPEGISFVRTQTNKSKTFRLFDIRKTFHDDDAEYDSAPLPGGGPRIHSLESFLASRQIEPPATMDVSGLVHRLAVLKQALDTLPRQAQRLARWHLRRSTLKSAKFRHALRPGPPPGGSKRPRSEAQKILRECHALAHLSQRLDTS